MKTDRFDEEFRRKLLGLPAEAAPGEVERIQGFVNANKPALPGFGWGKLLLYGGSSLLLIGSLSYNVIQTYRNTHLQSSIDSLVHRPVEQTAPSDVIRHDTVYITRSDNSIESAPMPNASDEANRQKSLDQTEASQSVGTVAMERPKVPQSASEAISRQSEAVYPRLETRPTESIPTNTSTGHNERSEGHGLSGQVSTEANESVATVPPVSPNGSLSPASRANNGRFLSRQQTRSGKRQTVSGKEKNELLATTYSSQKKQRTNSNPPTTAFPPTNTDNATSSASVTELSRQTITAELLASRPHSLSNQLVIISPSRPLIIPQSALTGKAIRRSWHMTMPSLSVPNAQYRIGAGLTGGSDLAGGALLGEIMLNRHWSVQAGVQLAYNQGFHYRDEQDFNEHQKEDFRQTYASQVPSSADIQDISQMSLLAQLPVQVAYHYPIGRQWGLRLGFGTNLTIWGHSALSYNYGDNGRSSKHELARSRESVYFVNNLMLNTSVERSWKKWLFRAGPFISPQFRPVGYKSDDLSWGANLQILYRLGK